MKKNVKNILCYKTYKKMQKKLVNSKKSCNFAV